MVWTNHSTVRIVVAVAMLVLIGLLVAYRLDTSQLTSPTPEVPTPVIPSPLQVAPLPATPLQDTPTATAHESRPPAFTQMVPKETWKTSIAIITGGLGKGRYQKDFSSSLCKDVENQHIAGNFDTLRSDWSVDHFNALNKRDKYAIDYIMFSDDTTDTNPPSRIVYKQKLEWTKNTENRFEYILDSREALSLYSYDFLYWMDADMKFVNNTCEDMLGQLVGAEHAMYRTPLAKAWPYEKRNTSTAYVPQENQHEQVYFHATLYGGESREFLEMLQVLKEWQDIDHVNGIQAAVDDESYLNKYFYLYPPNLILSPGYVWTGYVKKVKARSRWIEMRGRP